MAAASGQGRSPVTTAIRQGTSTGIRTRGNNSTAAQSDRRLVSDGTHTGREPEHTQGPEVESGQQLWGPAS